MTEPRNMRMPGRRYNPETKSVTVRIDLGDEAMQTPVDVADALHQVARDLAGDGFPADDRIVRDHNGNRVGRVMVEREAEEQLPTRDQLADMVDAHAEGLHADLPRQYCPDCELQGGAA